MGEKDFVRAKRRQLDLKDADVRSHETFKGLTTTGFLKTGKSMVID